MPGTCQWLTTHETFALWMDHDKTQDHCGFLHIKGRPGSGKSTLTRSTWIRIGKGQGRQNSFAFFFDASGRNALQRCRVGLYRCLVSKCLDAAAQELRSSFVAQFVSKAEGEAWNESELEDFIRKLAVGGALPETLFIDGLDEGDKNDVQQLLHFLHDLAERTISSGKVFRICLSSRPTINIGKGFSIDLDCEEKHRQDIEAYVNKKLRVSRLRQAVSAKSAGVFSWSKSVVDRLNAMHARGKSLEDQNRELEAMSSPLQLLQSSKD